MLAPTDGMTPHVERTKTEEDPFLFVPFSPTFFYFINLPHEGGPSGPWLPCRRDRGDLGDVGHDKVVFVFQL